MCVLNVPDGIIARLFRDFLEIEIQRRVILAGQHHEAQHIRADLIDNFTQSDELTSPFGHFHRLAGPKQPYQLA